MNKLIAALAFTVMSMTAWALPTTQDVEAAVRQGNYGQAESMMSEVVAAKPDSAKARYIYAEMLAHNRNFAKASQEAARARQLDPAIKFTTPDKFSAFEQLLQREQTAPTQTRAAPTAAAPSPARAAPSGFGIPGWVWMAGLGVIGFALWRGFNRSRTATSGVGSAGLAGTAPVVASPLTGAPGVAANMTPGAAQGMAANVPGMPGAARGSGMLGTGLAVAGGVAGGMLLGEMLHNRPGAGATPLDRVGPGADPLAANDAASELANRPVDFGNDGDWDAGGAADAGGDGGGGWD